MKILEFGNMIRNTVLTAAAAALLSASPLGAETAAPQRPGEEPVIGNIVQEIVLLKQLKALEMSEGQIHGILPELKRLLTAQTDFETRIQEAFRRERARVSGNDKPSPGGSEALKKEVQSRQTAFLRTRSTAESAIAKQLSTKQAEGLRRILASPLLSQKELTPEQREQLRKRVEQHRRDMEKRERPVCETPLSGPPPGGRDGGRPGPPPGHRHPFSMHTQRLQQTIAMLEEMLDKSSAQAESGEGN